MENAQDKQTPVPVPQSLQPTFAQAVRHHQAGRLADAEPLYRRVLAADAHHADSLHLLGVIAHYTDRQDLAVEMIGRAVAINVTAAPYHCSLGNALKAQGHIDQAIICYRQAIEIRPEYLDANNNLAAALSEQGRLADAEPLYRKALAINRTPELLSNLGLLRREQGDLAGAERLLREALALRPDFANALYNLGMTMIDANRPAEAVVFLSQRARDPGAPASVHANLARTFSALGDRTQALQHGRQALLRKDAQACTNFQARGGRKLAKIPTPRFDPQRPEQNIVAFSLWGDRATYVDGAIANAGLVRKLYPGWTCRVYLDDSVPSDARDALGAAGAQVVSMPATGTHYGLFWRFLVADDARVQYFICRDANSRINTQEAAAVAAWLGSGCPFHVMRDAPFHTELMLAGLWGGVGSCLQDLRERIDRFYRPAAHRWIDQDFLRAEVWPAIRDQTMIHDSCYDLFGAQPYPMAGRLADGDHVGACHILP